MNSGVLWAGNTRQLISLGRLTWAMTDSRKYSHHRDTQNNLHTALQIYARDSINGCLLMIMFPISTKNVLVTIILHIPSMWINSCPDGIGLEGTG